MVDDGTPGADSIGGDGRTGVASDAADIVVCGWVGVVQSLIENSWASKT